MNLSIFKTINHRVWANIGNIRDAIFIKAVILNCLTINQNQTHYASLPLFLCRHFDRHDHHLHQSPHLAITNDHRNHVGKQPLGARLDGRKRDGLVDAVTPHDSLGATIGLPRHPDQRHAWIFAFCGRASYQCA